MALFNPVVGLVFPYWYLWGSQANDGEQSGRKPRPALIIAVSPPANGPTSVVVSPFTTVSADLSRLATNEYMEAFPNWGAGLPTFPCWLILNEQNIFIWPGYDLTDNPEPYGKISGTVLRGILTQIHNLNTVPISRD